MIEANFRPRSAYERSRILALSDRPVEVNCACPAQEAHRRLTARAAGRHPVHVVHDVPPEVMAEFDRPVGIGEVITVDTTRPVDVAALAGRVLADLRAGV